MESIIISIAGPLTLLLLGIIGYYIVRESKRQDQTNDRLFDLLEKQRESTDRLSISITALNSIIQVSQFQFDEFEKRYDDHKEVCKYKFERVK